MEAEKVHNLDGVVVALHGAVDVVAGIAAAVVVDLGRRFRCSKNDWPSIQCLDHESMLQWRTE